ncbi:MAG: hypothetical protein EU532_12715 [Promethearchaeota archaeon]|nr:MAG: hypothetical protein EU532_12715 [Candidatus Lokiarchaeota archaeon]
MVDDKFYCSNNKKSIKCKDTFRFDEYEQFNKLKPKTNSEGRVKLIDQEKEKIRKEFLTGIPIQRINEIINNFNNISEDDFIKKLQSYYNKMVEKNLVKLSCGVSHIDNIIKGFENAVYLDRSISLKSIKELELLLNRKIQFIKNWRKPRRKRLSGVRIQITEEGIESIKDELNSGISIKRVSEIIKEYEKEDNFIRYLRKIYRLALKPLLD